MCNLLSCISDPPCFRHGVEPRIEIRVLSQLVQKHLRSTYSLPFIMASSCTCITHYQYTVILAIPGQNLFYGSGSSKGNSLIEIHLRAIVEVKDAGLTE